MLSSSSLSQSIKSTALLSARKKRGTTARRPFREEEGRKDAAMGPHGDGKRKRALSDDADDEMDAFFGVCEANGCKRADGDGDDDPFVLTRDARDFVNALELKLATDARARQAFVRDLESFAEGEDSLGALLKPLGHGDSLAHCLLNVFCLQTPVSTLLLERIPQLDSADKSQKDAMTLIINQFRWLDVNSEDSAILEKFLEVMAVTDEAFQKDMIQFLPEVTVTDDQADRVAEFLLDKMEENSAFTDTVIETVPSLCISDRVRNEVTRKILDHIPAVGVEDLGKVVKFLLENCTAATYEAIVMALRSHLHFVDLGDPRRKAPDRKQKGKAVADLEQTMVRSIRSSLRCTPQAASYFHKVLKSLDSREKCCTLDLWALFLLLSFGGDRASQARQLVHRKVAGGQITEDIAGTAIRGHRGALSDLFGTILALTSSLVKCKARTVAKMGQVLYALLFETFEEMHQRQDILGEIVAHLGSRNKMEMDGALSSLAAIARESLDSLAPFASYLATLLDHIDTFTHDQTRELFWVISEITAPAHGDSQATGHHSRLEDEVHILIRKMMSSKCQSHFKSGVIGSLALIGKKERLIECSSTPSRSAKDVCHMLKQMFRECYRNPESLGFCYQEVAQAVYQDRFSNEMVLRVVNEMVTDDFESTFLGDMEDGELARGSGDPPTTSYAIAAETWFNLDGQDSPVALRILPFSASKDREEQLQLAKLPAQIHLIQLLSKRVDKSLDDIDALLGCPLVLFSRETLDNGGARNVAAQTLVAAINWVREILNAFTEDMGFLTKDTPDATKEVVRKVVERVGNLYFLEVCLTLLRQKSTERKGRGIIAEPKQQNTTQTTTATAFTTTTAATAATAAYGGHRDAIFFTDLGHELEKSVKHFATLQLRPLVKSNFSVLFLACSPCVHKIGNGSALIPTWTYLLHMMRNECVSQGNGTFSAALDLVDFKPGGCDNQVNLPFVLKTLQKVFLDHLSEQKTLEGSSPSEDASMEPETVYGRAKTMVEDSLSAANFGLELISDILCHTIDACGDMDTLFKFFCYFLGIGEDDASHASAIAGFLEIVSVHYDSDISFDHKYKSVQVIVATCDKVETHLGYEDSRFDLTSLRRKTFSKVQELLTELDPSSFSGRKLTSAKRAKIIEHLLRSYSLLCETPLASLEEMVMAYVRYATSVLGHGGKGESPYPLLDKQSIPVWYSHLFQWLNTTIQRHLGESKKDETQLDKVQQCAFLFTKLINLPKKVEKSALFLRHIVKNGQQFLDAMAKIEKNDWQDNPKVVSILKELQKGVKFIHTICSECKTQKNSLLASKVPALKRTVERFIWKCLLWLHNNDEKIEMGSLKHRDIKGNVVQSQLELSSFDFDKENLANMSDTDTDTDAERESQKSLLINQSLQLSFEV